MRNDASPVKILVVDDEPPIRKLLRVGLAAQGYAVIEAANGKAALEQLARTSARTSSCSISACPTSRGHELLTRLARARAATVPIVILSSRTDEAGIVQALELGADDYVTKPFGMNELLARIRVALRHRLAAAGREAGVPDRRARRSTSSAASSRSMDEEVKLSPKEYDILRVLVQHAGKVLTHHFLLRQVWGDAQRRRSICGSMSASSGRRSSQSRDQPRYILHRDRRRLPAACR